MAYFLVTSSVNDGEYEYWRYVRVKAVSQEEAEAKGLKADQE